MKIISTNVYVGPNLHANFPVIRFLIELGELEEWPTARLGKTFIDNLLKALPGIMKSISSGSQFESPIAITGIFISHYQKEGIRLLPESKTFYKPSL